MGVEIERKYLVVGDDWRARVVRSIEMHQGYLNDLNMVESGSMRSSVRVRIQGEQAFINIKSAQRGEQRLEFEYSIPVADARELLNLSVGGLVSKTRHLVEHDGFTWEIDEFHDENQGLIVAEIELPATDTLFDIPGWAGLDVTDTLRYYNLSLADYPYSRWTEHERAPDPVKEI